MNPEGEEKALGNGQTLSPTTMKPSPSWSSTSQQHMTRPNVNNYDTTINHDNKTTSQEPINSSTATLPLVVSIPSHSALSSSSTTSTPYTMSSPGQLHNHHLLNNGMISSPSRGNYHHYPHHEQQHEPFFSFGSSSSFHSASTAAIPNPYDMNPHVVVPQQSNHLTIDTQSSKHQGEHAVPLNDADHFQTFPSVSSLGRLVNGIPSPLIPIGTSSNAADMNNNTKMQVSSSLTPGSVLSLRTVNSSVFSPSQRNEELHFENANNTSISATTIKNSKSGRMLDVKASAGVSSSVTGFTVGNTKSFQQLSINNNTSNSPVVPVSSPVNVEYYHHVESKDDFSLLASKRNAPTTEFHEVELDSKAKTKNLFNESNSEDEETVISTDEDESHRPSVDTSRRSVEILLRDDMDIGKDKVKTEKSEREHLWRAYTKTNMFFCVWNLINDVISPASVSAGYTIAQAGLGAYIVSVLTFGVVTFFTLMLLYDLAHMFKVTSFPALMKKALGTVGYIIICVFIFIFNFGAVCSELIEISQVLPDLLYTIIGYESIFTSRYAILIYVTIILLPIASMKQMSSFKYASMISVSSMIIIAFLIMYECALGRRTVMYSDTAFNFVRPQYLSAMGSLSFVFVCHDISFEIIGSLKDNTKKRYMMVVFFMLCLAVTTLFLMGISSYLIFFDTNLRDANVLDLFPKKLTMAIVARILVCVSLGLSICYSAFMPRFAIITVLKTLMNYMAGMKEREQEMELKHNSSSSADVIDSRPRYIKFFTSKTGKDVLHYSVTLFVVLSAFSIAIAVSNLGVIIGLTGAISGSSMAYILPCLAYIILEKRHRQQKQVREIMIHSRWLLLKRIAAYIVLALGSLLLVSSLGSITYFEIAKAAT
ncbi:hypothetical protein FDP41_000724 [Naegleria fowleri]|uniref:Amino acid transporter transmembrane domain-containing protein n=1 Tax=Naegleria fowleri TaxID=5763 RepID=A0A6A5CHP9_NAEFO|nr:uncharacterized protein FDP41_000724 [Naegleria fowleri]KAF0984825.1 hypothetical protein FDP41_000724 [Naegleria fowleri]